MIYNDKLRMKAMSVSNILGRYCNDLQNTAASVKECAEMPFGSFEVPQDALLNAEEDLRNMRQDLSALERRLAEVRNALEEGSEE